VDTGFVLDHWTARRIGLTGSLTREALDTWQLARLRATLARARADSPFYRDRRDWPADPVTSLADLARFPFTTAADLAQAEPSFLAVPADEAGRAVMLTTSGTSGPPKRMFFTGADRESTIDFFHQGLGIVARAGDRVVIVFPSERPGGIGDALAAAVRRLGARPIVAPAPMTPEDLAAFVWAEQATVVVGPPVALLAAARVSAHDGGPPIRIRAALVSSDRASPSLVAALGALWGCAVRDHWGMTEIGYGGAVSCGRDGGCHLREADLLVEVIDPATGAPLADGETGELVVTTLTQRGMPFVRYRTGDLARLETGRCGCGSLLRRIVGFAGRRGGAIALPAGDSFSLATLDDALFGLEAVTDFTARVTPGDPVELEIVLATPASLRDREVLHEARVALSRDAVLGPALAAGHLHLRVTLAEAAAISPAGKRRLEQLPAMAAYPG
jgi:phenylacetate-coenzyme A ligase PaaK-like adenylate-forming protein